MTEAEIIETTNKVFSESFELENSQLTPDARIFEDLGLDSLDIVDLGGCLAESIRCQHP